MAGKKPSIVYYYEAIETSEVNTIRKRVRIDLDEKTISYSVNNLFPKTQNLPTSLPATFDSFENVNEMLKIVNSICLYVMVSHQTFIIVSLRNVQIMDFLKTASGDRTSNIF